MRSFSSFPLFLPFERFEQRRQLAIFFFPLLSRRSRFFSRRVHSAPRGRSLSRDAFFFPPPLLYGWRRAGAVRSPSSSPSTARSHNVGRPVGVGERFGLSFSRDTRPEAVFSFPLPSSAKNDGTPRRGCARLGIPPSEWKVRVIFASLLFFLPLHRRYGRGAAGRCQTSPYAMPFSAFFSFLP